MLEFLYLRFEVPHPVKGVGEQVCEHIISGRSRVHSSVSMCFYHDFLSQAFSRVAEQSSRKSSTRLEQETAGQDVGDYGEMRKYPGRREGTSCW